MFSAGVLCDGNTQASQREVLEIQLIALCYEAWSYVTQGILCSATQIFHVMFQIKTGKPPPQNTDFHCGTDKHVKLVTHHFLVMLDAVAQEA